MSIFWRGVARLKAGEATEAKQDFSTCIAIRDDWIAPRYNRALASRATQAIPDAINDLNWIVDSGNGSPRVFSLRSQLWAVLGDRTKYASDRKLALEAQPVEADDWVAQGVLKIGKNPEEALSDFANALKIAPNNVAALMNTAHVQAEILHDNEAGVATLTSLIDSGLGGTSAIASRGILRARSGHHRQAKQDAQLAANGKPFCAGDVTNRRNLRDRWRGSTRSGIRANLAREIDGRRSRPETTGRSRPRPSQFEGHSQISQSWSRQRSE